MVTRPTLPLTFYADAEEQPTWSVSQLNAALRAAVSDAFPDDIWVRGEITGLKPPNRSGHVYFELVERSPRAAIRVALFSTSRQRVEAFLRRSGSGDFELEDGLQVRISGRLDFYVDGGTLSLRMTGIDPEFTLGRLAQDRDRLVRQLTAEGLIQRQRQLSVPLVPLDIAVVTSRQAAGFGDFCDELARSGFGWRVRLVETPVQGQVVARRIARAIEYAAALPAVQAVVLLRGGGSRTELAVFDHERVARAVAGAAVPVWTGIGHEQDTSVADLVAHTRHNTPTACAAALVERVQSYLRRSENAWRAIATTGARALLSADARLRRRARRLAQATRSTLVIGEQTLERAATTLAGEPTRRLDAEAARLDRIAADLTRRTDRRLTAAAVHLDHLGARIDALDPARVLARGYSITRRAGDGALAREASAIKPGDVLLTTLHKGAVRSTADDGTLVDPT